MSIAVAIAVSVVSAPAARGQQSDLTAAREAFGYLHTVAMHPRCMNCHGGLHRGVRVPLVSDDMRPHPMNITSAHNATHAKLTRFEQAPGSGITCSSCHGYANSAQPGGPPGAPLAPFVWHMPVRDGTMLWPHISRIDLCLRWQRMIAKPSPQPEGGHRTESFENAVHEHFAHDSLIAWAFQPGPGRTPAPGSLAQLVEKAGIWARWIEAPGHSCEQLGDS